MFPTLYDEVYNVSTSKLKEWGYLVPGQWKSGVITWSNNGNKTGSISIAVKLVDYTQHLELDYTFNGEPVKYRVELVTVPSNLGKGVVWYFICPHSGKRCRKLYLIGRRFLHREAFTGCMYEIQTYSHKNRNLTKLMDKVFGVDKLYEQLYSKHFKRYYAGKPTKRYRALQKKIQQAEEINYKEVERFISTM